jgi:hypothetical protein
MKKISKKNMRNIILVGAVLSPAAPCRGVKYGRHNASSRATRALQARPNPTAIDDSDIPIYNGSIYAMEL